MASTLIKRICTPWDMTDAEKASVMSEKAYMSEDELKLKLHSVACIASEIDSGRMPSTAIDQWLTIAEKTDASLLLALLTTGTLTIQEVWLLFLGCESGTVTVAYVEAVLGL